MRGCVAKGRSAKISAFAKSGQAANATGGATCAAVPSALANAGTLFSEKASRLSVVPLIDFSRLSGID